MNEPVRVDPASADPPATETPRADAPAGNAPRVVELTTLQFVERARQLLTSSRRVILGITGAPGSGKSTVAAAVTSALSRDSVLVGMDGFHLANAELVRLGRRDRKGAPDTFDAGGYVALLRRLRARDEQVVYVPVFDRAIEESIGSAVPVAADVPLVVTEGNYLLLESDGWAEVRSLLDVCWYVEVDDDVRLERLVRRHAEFGKTLEQAAAWARGSDQANSEVIAATRGRADVVVRVVPDS